MRYYRVSRINFTVIVGDDLNLAKGFQMFRLCTMYISHLLVG